MRRNTHFQDAYDWVADVREYTDRIRQGPIKETDLAGQMHINERAALVEKALDDLNRVLPGGNVHRLYEALTLPLRTYLSLIAVPRALWAEPVVRRSILLPRRNGRG